MNENKSLLRRIEDLESSLARAHATEKKLRQTELEFRTMADLNYDWVYWITPGGNLKYVSPSCERLTGYSAQEYIENPALVDQITHPKDRQIAGYETHTPVPAEKDRMDVRIITRSGEVRWVERNSKLIFSKDGEFRGRLVSNHDVTDCKKADETAKKSEETLRESEDKFLTAFMNSPVAMFIASETDQKYVEVNHVFVKDAGFSHAEIIGHTFDELKLFLDDSNYRRLLDDVHKHGCAYGREMNFRMKSGQERVCSVSANIIQIGGKPHLIASILDVTNVKKMMEALTESEERFRLAVATTPDAISITRLTDGIFIEVNDAFTKMTGYTRDEVLNKTVTDINIWHGPEELAKIGQLISQKGVCVNEQATFQRKDGSLFYGLISASVMSHKSELHIISITRDITERLEAELEKRDIQERLFQAQKMESLGTLVGGIAHDFNNMLQIIMGYAEVIMDRHDRDKKDIADLKTIIQTSQEGADLIKRLLAFVQQAQVVPSPLNVNFQIEGLTSLLSRTLPNIVQLELDLTGEQAIINADKNQMDQLIMNLAINASEAMINGGRLRISTRMETLDEEYCKKNGCSKSGVYVLLTVTDNGVGMDKDTMSKIFDPFFSTKERGSKKGTGLGLSVVHGIVQQQGGMVTCDSEPGKGSEFRVYFPAMEAPPQILKTDSQEDQLVEAPTILVVEDNPFVAELERSFLESSGYEVVMAFNGKEALEIYRKKKEKIALVIMDLIMPEMSGKDCLMELLKINPSVRVLIVSGYTQEDELRRQISPHIKGFMRKPHRMSELFRAVRSALDSQ